MKTSNIGKSTLIIFIILCFLIRNSASANLGASRKDLVTQLFTDYDSDLRPLCATDQVVTVDVDIAVRQIIDLNEQAQILSVNLWVMLKWEDCRLRWNVRSE